MNTITLDLPEELQTFVESQAAQEGLSGAEEYVRQLILEAQRRMAGARLEDLLLAGEQSPRARVDDAWWERVTAEAQAEAESRESRGRFLE